MKLTGKQLQFIRDALEYNAGTQTLEQVESEIESGRFNVWPSENSVVVTEFCHYPNKTFINIVLGGGDLAEIKQTVRQIEAQAQTLGLSGVMIVGRRAWGRVLPGYAERATVYVKEI